MRASETRAGADSPGAAGGSSSGARGPGVPEEPGSVPSPVRRLLRIPLFHKVLLANAVVVLLAAGVVTYLTVEVARATGEDVTLGWAAFAAFLGLVGISALNAFLVRVALRPLRDLESAARASQRERFDVRVPESPLADSELRRLIDAFNGTLDTLRDERSRLRALATRALDVAEEERRRIARELVDDVAQQLASLLVGLQAARRAEEPGARDEFLGKLRDELAGTLERIRSAARRLRPPELGEIGVDRAIRAFVRSTAGAEGLTVELDLEPPGRDLKPGTELAVYRVAQEALTNVVRHAGASRVEVTLRPFSGALELTIRDDGRGFVVPREPARHPEALGLLGIAERARHAGGSVDVESRPGAGTRVRAVFPLDELDEGEGAGGAAG